MSDYNPRDARYVPDAPIPVGDIIAPAPAPAATSDATRVIEKRASVNDAYDGGQKILRDTSTLEGGTPGHVNTPDFVQVIVGKLVTAFEWARLTVLHNHADAGENTAGYSQANKHSTGPTWGHVSEVCDTTGNAGLAVPHEFDTWVTGPDNGQRPGVWSVLGDSLNIRNKQPSPQEVGGSSAFTAESMPNTVWTRAFRMVGRFLVGIDFSTADEIRTGTVIRMRAGQAIAFDQYDSFKVLAEDNRIKFVAYGRPVFEIDMSTGETYRMGVKQP